MDGGLIKILSVAVGGALGSVARYLTSISPFVNLFERFPFPTFFVNVLGSFLIGFLLIFFSGKFSQYENLRLFVLVGFLGAFTTFSTFELEIWGLVSDNRYLVAVLYLTLSVIVGFAGLALGIWVANRF